MCKCVREREREEENERERERERERENSFPHTLFMSDMSCTLSMRMLSNERWKPHCKHK